MDEDPELRPLSSRLLLRTLSSGHAWKSTLARNTGWLLLGQGGRLLTNGLYFVLIGRSLGAEGFGAFAAVLALVNILVPFAGWGSDKVLVMYVAREPGSFPEYWGHVLLTTAVGGAVFTLLVLGSSALILPNLSVGLIVTIAMAELFFGTVRGAAGSAYQAVERLRVTAQLVVMEGSVRLAAAGLFAILVTRPTAEAWGLWYLGAMLVAALISLARVTRDFGLPTFVPSLVPRHFWSGWNFSLGLASGSIYNDIDKTMLARLDTLEATGIYAAAYRVIDMAFAPVAALLSATYARFFRQGAMGIRGSLAFAKRLVPFSCAYGAAATVGLILAAPIIPHILGPEYRESVQAIQLLAPLPFLKSLHRFASDALTGAGLLGTRSTIQIMVAILNVLLNLWLIPLYSWKGAVWASLMTDGLLVLVFWGIVFFLARRASTLTHASAA